MLLNIYTMCVLLILRCECREVPSSCHQQEFKCTNSKCIDDVLLCDGKPDCLDKSDETQHVCSSVPCPNYAFTCKYGGCIHRKYKCNGVQDCVDNSDEESCSNNLLTEQFRRPVAAPNYQSFAYENIVDQSTSLQHAKTEKHTCDSGEVINEELICDGKADCKDRSDETYRLCSNIHCPYFTFRCNYGACINLNKKCNGIRDCIDGSDENLCSTPSTVKPEAQSTTTQRTIKNLFRCRSGELIDEEFLCDGEPDCTDLSDETFSECSKFHCPSFTYKCKYGACVLSGAKCNGIKECADNSDEDSCSETEQTFTIIISEFKCNSGQTIDNEMVCDGKADCEDSSDEALNTCSHINCPRFTYRCNYGACVHGRARCNGLKECNDNSDEALCPKTNFSVVKGNEPLKDRLTFTS